MNEMKVSINRNGLLSKKITFKILNNGYDRFQWIRARYRHFHKWQVEKICGRRHRATLQNYKATWTSLLTNEKAKSTFYKATSSPESPSNVSADYFCCLLTLEQNNHKSIILCFKYKKDWPSKPSNDC